MKVEYCLWRGASGSVFAITSAISATLAEEEDHFSPFNMEFSLPSFTAEVCMPVTSAPAAFSVIEKQIRLSPFNSGFKNFSFWYSVPCARIVIIEASSGPCVFIDSAPSRLSPSSICTSAFASGPSPIPPYSFGTTGHHNPSVRAFVRSLPSTSSNGLLSISFSAGMHSSCTHLRTFSRMALASAGISKSIDMAFPLGCFLKWHISETRQRPRQTKLKAPCVIPRACEVSNMPRRLLSTAVLVFTGSSGRACHRAALALTRWLDDEVKVKNARSRRSFSRLSIEMDQHLFGPHLCPRRRQRSAAAVAARIFVDPCDVAPGGAAACR